jgi:linoleate 10R-lipoxygenase
MSNLPDGKVSKFVQDKVISLLWYDLPHPPATYIADEYRHPDGSGNNPHFPDLGKAGSSYSRSVQSTTAMPDIEQPDPGLVFDSLLRREAFVEHPAGNSAMMFG